MRRLTWKYMNPSDFQKRILILYSEVMPYTLGLIEEMSQRESTQVILVYWDQIRLTPFTFKLPEEIRMIPRSKLTWDLVEDELVPFQPTHIWTSGRMDSFYLKINSSLKKRYPKTLSITGCDNQWEGTIKDQLRSMLGYWMYRKHFDFIWVPGPKQEEFALKIGFQKNKIIHNLLSCSPIWFENQSQLTQKRILFVGRLVPNKNIQFLIDAFELLPKEFSKDIFLRIVGSGDPMNLKIQHSNIEVFQFESQEKLISHGLNSDLFCLPSIHEPFGVVVHEFAAMGLPLALSTKVGAKPVFLNENLNGFSFNPNNVNELSEKLKHYYSLPLEKKLDMGKRSFELAQQVNPKSAVDSFLSIN